jgi:hypothetical protein
VQLIAPASPPGAEAGSEGSYWGKLVVLQFPQEPTRHMVGETRIRTTVPGHHVAGTEHSDCRAIRRNNRGTDMPAYRPGAASKIHSAPLANGCTRHGINSPISENNHAGPSSGASEIDSPDTEFLNALHAAHPS